MRASRDSSSNDLISYPTESLYRCCSFIDYLLIVCYYIIIIVFLILHECLSLAQSSDQNDLVPGFNETYIS